MTDWADDRAREAVDAGDIGGELTAAQWSALHREFSAVLRERCIPREPAHHNETETIAKQGSMGMAEEEIRKEVIRLRKLAYGTSEVADILGITWERVVKIWNER